MHHLSVSQTLQTLKPTTASMSARQALRASSLTQAVAKGARNSRLHIPPTSTDLMRLAKNGSTSAAT
eukprot:8117824-Alexandrium_andersonii.AAC.1